MGKLFFYYFILGIVEGRAGPKPKNRVELVNSQPIKCDKITNFVLP